MKPMEFIMKIFFPSQARKIPLLAFTCNYISQFLSHVAAPTQPIPRRPYSGLRPHVPGVAGKHPRHETSSPGKINRASRAACAGPPGAVY